MAETLQVIITADNKEAIQSIQDVIKSTEGLKSQFKKVGSASNEANQALINSGRVLQDLNYGFMGIANNLNPLLESFQRLGNKTKENSSVTEELKKAFMGPAGLGVALSALTFILLKFGDDIGKFFASLSSGGKELVALNDTFSASKDAFVKAYVEMQNLGVAFEEFHKGTRTKKQVLDDYNKSLGVTAGNTKDINEAEKIYNANKDKYVQAALYRAAANIAIQKSAEEAFKAQEAIFNPKGAVKSTMGIGETIGTGLLSKFTGVPVLSLSEALGSEAIAKKSNANLEMYKNISDTFNKMASNIEKTITHTTTYGEEVDKLTKAYDGLNKELNLELQISKRLRDNASGILGKQEIIPMYSDKETSVTGKKKADMKSEYDRILKGDNTLGLYLENLTKNLMPDIEIEKLLFQESVDGWKKSKEAAKDFANTMANDITGALRSTWDAIQSGQSVFDALTDSLMKFIEELGFAILKAQILSSIQNSMKTSSSGQTGAAAGGSGFFDLLFTLLQVVPFANGGIVNKPTFSMIGEAGPEAVMPLSKLSGMMNSTFNAGAMSGQSTGGNGQFVLKGQDLILAINRSNSSLNLRRGF